MTTKIDVAGGSSIQFPGELSDLASQSGDCIQTNSVVQPKSLYSWSTNYTRYEDIEGMNINLPVCSTVSNIFTYSLSVGGSERHVSNLTEPIVITILTPPNDNPNFTRIYLLTFPSFLF